MQSANSRSLAKPDLEFLIARVLMVDSKLVASGDTPRSLLILCCSIPDHSVSMAVGDDSNAAETCTLLHLAFYSGATCKPSDVKKGKEVRVWKPWHSVELSEGHALHTLVGGRAHRMVLSSRFAVVDSVTVDAD
jgi:hypothetical protein